jgi:hypothetical protein
VQKDKWTDGEMERRDKRRDGYIQTDLDNVINGEMNRKTDGKID